MSSPLNGQPPDKVSHIGIRRLFAAGLLAFLLGAGIIGVATGTSTAIQEQRHKAIGVIVAISGACLSIASAIWLYRAENRPRN